MSPERMSRMTDEELGQALRALEPLLLQPEQKPFKSTQQMSLVERIDFGGNFDSIAHGSTIICRESKKEAVVSGSLAPYTMDKSALSNILKKNDLCLNSTFAN